jgi:YVTN family beta-propeller protein
VDAGTRAVVASIPITSDLRRRLALTHDGNRLYVTNSLSDTVTVIDTSSFAVVATIPFYFFPVSIAMGVPRATVVEYFNPDLDNYFVTADPPSRHSSIPAPSGTGNEQD